jgi:polyphosphate glucokinase
MVVRWLVGFRAHCSARRASVILSYGVVVVVVQTAFFGRMKVLVIDIGGSHVKFKVWGQRAKFKFDSGRKLTPQIMVREVLAVVTQWEYDVVSIGYPGPVIHGRPAAEPPNLGRGWLRFNFEKHFRKPIKIINDAAMQALGSYNGGRMLFLGLGTGLGSALVLDDIIVPLDLGDLAYNKDKTLAEVLGKAGLKEMGRSSWERSLHRVANHLVSAFRADYLVIGGGNAKLLKSLPAKARRGSNNKAFAGGARLWRARNGVAAPQKHTWLVA